MTDSQADERQITLANWRQHPLTEWSFRNVRELLPTADIARSNAPAPLQLAPHGVDGCRQHRRLVWFGARDVSLMAASWHLADLVVSLLFKPIAEAQA
jgi:hypothetical protein